MKFMMKMTAIVIVVLSVSGCTNSTESMKNVPTQNSTAVAKEDVTVVASDFQFDQAEYKVKKGEQVNFTLKVDSGNHGFLIPELDISMTEPGSKAYKLDKPGTYEIVCNIPCGSGHMSMKSKLIVE